MKSFAIGSSLLFMVSGISFADTEEIKSNYSEEAYLPVIEVRDKQNNGDKTYLMSHQIEQRQADNLGELLDSIPGVQMSGSPRPNGQSVNIWGMGDEEDIRITIDGAQKNFERYQQGTLFIEPELIKRVEVDKGSFDVQRANGAFGGGVKLETRDARDFLRGTQKSIGGLVKFGYHTNNDLKQYSAAVFMDSGIWDALVYYTHRNSNNIVMPSGEEFYFSGVDSNSFLLKSNLYISDLSKLTFSFVRGQNKGWQPFAAKSGNTITISQRDIDRYGFMNAWYRRMVYRDQDDSSFSMKYKYQPDHPWIDLTAIYSYSRTAQKDSRLDNASFSIATGGKFTNSTYTNHNVEIYNKSHFDFGKVNHQLLIGLAGNYHKRDVMMYMPRYASDANYNYGWYIPYFMPSGTQHIFSFYVQDAMKYSKFMLTTGFRYDYVKNQGVVNPAIVYSNLSAGQDYSAVTYKGWSHYLKLDYELTRSVNLFAHMAHVWRAPMIDEQYEVQSATSSRSATSRHLKPERVTEFKVGFVSMFDNMFVQGDSMSIRANYFTIRGRNEIFKDRGVFCQQQAVTGSSNRRVCGDLGNVSNYRNMPGYDIKGVETEIYYNSAKFFASLAGTYVKGYWRASPRNPWFGRKVWYSHTPPAKIITTLGYKVNKMNLSFGWRGEFFRRVDRSAVDSDPRAAYWALPKSKGYGLHGIFAQWQPRKNIDVRLTIDNVFNRQYAPYLSELVSGVGRNIKVSTAIQF